jgi:hypothetical protein
MTIRNRIHLLALVVRGSLTAAVAAGWITGGLPMPLIAADDALALLVLPPTAVAWTVLASALVGLMSALLLLGRGLGNRRLLVVASSVQLLVFGLAVLSPPP